MMKLTSDKILEALELLESVNEQIKGFDEYSNVNQRILLQTFSVPEIRRYISIDRSEQVYYCEKTRHYIKSFGKRVLMVGSDGKKFQLTNHTLYTYIQEFGLLLSDFTLVKKGKKDESASSTL